MKRRAALVLGSALLFFCVEGRAQETASTGKTSPTLDQVVVTATKTEERRKDVPNSMILIGEEDIQEAPVRGLGELLRNEMGLDLRTYGNYGGASEEIHIRGMSGNATQVLVNGIRVNSPSLGTADVSRIPLNAIERIEVVKGSGSLLYGSGAMGGTVSILTKSPKRGRADLKLEAEAGTQGTYGFSGEQGTFLTEDLGYYLTAHARTANGFRDNSDLDHGNASLKILLDKGDPLRVSLYGDYLYRSYGLPGLQPPPYTGEYYRGPQPFYNNKAASLLDKAREKDTHTALEIKSDPWKWLGVTLRTDLTDMDSYTYSRYAFSGEGSRSWTANQVHSSEGYVDIKPLPGGSVLLGGEYRHYDWETEEVSLDSNGSEIPNTQSNTTANMHSTGVYAEAQYRPVKYVKGLAGIRHEDHSEFGDKDLPRWGLVVNPLESTALKWSHGKHFLAPTPNDLFWPAGPYARGNPDLKPETGWHTDYTLEQGLFKDKLFLNLTYFDWDVNDKIRWAPDASGVWTPQNLDRYRGKGWEAGVKVGPFWDLTFSLNYTYTDAEETNPFVTRVAEYTAEDTFKGSVTYWTDFGLTATCTVSRVGERIYYGSDRNTLTPIANLDPYWNLDLRLDQRFLKHWVVSLIGSNLTDSDYETYLGNFTDLNTWRTALTSYPGAGRAVFLSVSYQY